jgi:hypothetical protein
VAGSFATTSLQTVVSVEARWSVAQPVAGPVGVQPAGYEPIAYQSLGYRLKRTLLGRPLPTFRLVHERLRKLVALAVFSSDAISSTAYGTEQIMLILIAGGAVATRLAFPIALAASATRTPPGIVARAWLRVIWACWHTGTPYDPHAHLAEQRLTIA